MFLDQFTSVRGRDVFPTGREIEITNYKRGGFAGLKDISQQQLFAQNQVNGEV
jgi:hypothetical protein